ncbi:MAG: nucleotidyltransferase [Proteobacteria bacterium]|nr:nucleotidyltransferase [Pseudomonadota bacterium]
MPVPPALAARPSSDPVKISGFPPDEAQSTIGGCFGVFLRRAVPGHTAYGVARGACVPAVAALRGELYPKGDTTVDHFVVGGIGKRTALAPISRVDVIYLLPPKLAATKASDALKVVWAVLKSRFPGTRLAEHTVVVPQDNIEIHVVPAREHGQAFLIPGATAHAGGWILSNPVAEAATLRLSDSLYGGRPRLLLTALKAWRANVEASISAFALEQLVQEFYAGAPRPYDLERALIDFWAWSRKRTPCTVKPPGGATPLEIGESWHGKAKAAYWRVTLADHHLKTGKLIDAAVEWRQVLGPAFPVPGETPLRTLPLFKKKTA